MKENNRISFGSKFGVYVATVGSAVGLGNIWRFPYLTGNNGGAAFILIYLICVLLIGIPIFMSELIIGRRGQGNSFRVFKNLAPEKPWYFIGILGFFSVFIILSFYGTIAGWTIEYIYLSVKSLFVQTQNSDYTAVFNDFHTSTFAPVVCQILFMIMTAIIILFGVQKGIENCSKILLPILFVILVILCVRSLMLPNSIEGLKFLFYPDFSKITTSVFLNALGQAFFSLSIGMGTIITYGSYVKKDNNLPKTSFLVSLTDMFIAILAGVAIFPALFSFGMSPSEGPGLVFIVLPEVFGQMVGGSFFSLLFFILLLVAALTSSISLLEVVVLFLIEECKMKRWAATVVSAIGATILGVFTTLSFGPLKDVNIFGKSIFDSADFLATNIFLPLSGFFIVIFLGWFYPKKNIKNEITNDGTIRFKLFPIYLFIIKFVAPIAIIFVFLRGLGIL
ncbi:MAG: sodium-dependent transporter [Bacteroidales bacterium]|jgi:NSS family neurotransmitter:Na+ symporter|nr:sodium-dependent transporter [Bacteroidales bacterium]